MNDNNFNINIDNEYDISCYFNNDNNIKITNDQARDYLNKIGSIKVLSFDEEKQLFDKYINGDKDAKNIIIYHNLKLVAYNAKFFLNRGLDFLDLIQEGNIGLMKAVDKFDPSLGNKFSTYATWWIKQAMLRAIANHSRIIRLPNYYFLELNNYKKYCDMFYSKKGRYPTDYEASIQLKISLDKIKEFNMFDTEPISLNLKVLDDSNSCIEDFIVSDDDTEEIIFDKELSFILRDCLNKLNISNRDKYIIYERFGLNGNELKTLGNLGKELNLTSERIRQIEKNTLNKIYKSNYNESLREFYDSNCIKNDDNTLNNKKNIDNFINIIDLYKDEFEDLEIKILYDFLGLNDKIYSIPDIIKKYNISLDQVNNAIKKYNNLVKKKEKVKKLVLD